MGTLHSGDVILAINDQGLENATLRDAAQMLKNAGDVIRLKVNKENGEFVPVINYCQVSKKHNTP